MNNHSDQVEKVVENAPDHKPYRSERLLRKLYEEHQQSTHEIAELLGCSQSTVRAWMDKFDISRRSRSRARIIQSSGHHNEVRRKVRQDGHIVWKTTDRDNVDRTIFEHRLLAVSQCGLDAIRGKHVHHKNGIPWDNRPSNIELLDPSEHKALHKRKIQGIDRLKVAELYENGDMSSRDLAEKFNVVSTTVLSIHDEFYGESGDQYVY